ncbi:MAG: flagellar hook-length control protein FliK, partial [Synergistaceae bacterium]|nr:flagellar hook-length control protein FliK [Synergistaceae bacterium]
SNNGQNGQKIQAKNQNEKSSTLSNSQRIEAHDNFQNFFEGVVNNRRTVSQNSPLPLNLRAGNVNFTPSQTLREGLVNTVRFIRADGVQKANIIVDPPALGRISVELTSSSSGVEASIKVANEQIRQLVQDQISQLRMNLSDQGVQVAEFTVDVQQDNHFGGQGQGQNNSQEENGRRDFVREISSEDTEEFNIDLEEGLLYWVA